MGQLQFLSSGTLTTLQDTGRAGLAYYAIPRCGPLDTFSAALANLLLRNHRTAPVIETTLIPPQIEFHASASIAITGALRQWSVNHKPIQMCQVVSLEAGDILTGAAKSQGLRNYIAIAGRFNAESHWGSCSMDQYAQWGAQHGRPFRAGDKLTWTQPPSKPHWLRIEHRPLPTTHVDLIPGPEFSQLCSSSQITLATHTFSVDSRSNRMGARLKGPLLDLNTSHLATSVPVVPGILQWTPSGELIVILQDGQTTGGYPRIGYVPRKALNQFNQLLPGQPFHWNLLTQ